MDRKAFIKTTGRWMILGGLGSISALLLYRQRFGNPETCFTNPFCGSCGKFSACSKIQAKIEQRDGTR